MYRIAWRSLLTGLRGGGEFCLDKTTAKDSVKPLNREYAGIIHHWIEKQEGCEHDLNCVGL